MNKNNFLFCLLLVLTLSGCKQTVTDVGSGLSFDCVVHNSDVSCWGYYAKSGLEYGSETEMVYVNTRRQYQDPQLAVGVQHYCVLDQGTVDCFLNNELGQKEVPELVNPYEISAGMHFTCALDDTGLVCWGDPGAVFDINPLDDILINPRNLTAGAGNLCLTDDNGLHCGGMTLYKQIADYEHPEDITGISLLTGGGLSFYTCGLAEEWVCWGEPNGPFSTELNDISLVVPGAYQICGVVSGDVECWGDSLYSGSDTSQINQKITNPIDISISVGGICVAGDEGVLCENENMIEPPYYLRAD